MRGRLLLLIVALGHLLVLQLLAAGPTGTIVGTVTDPSGAVVPKAQVTVRNQETNAAREVETNEDGDYSVPLLPPAPYQVTIEKPGFRRSVYGDVKTVTNSTSSPMTRRSIFSTSLKTKLRSRTFMSRI